MLASVSVRGDLTQGPKALQLTLLSKYLFWSWLALLGVSVLTISYLSVFPGELLHIGRRDLLIMFGALLLAELIVTLPLLVVAAILDWRAKRSSG